LYFRSPNKNHMKLCLCFTWKWNSVLNLMSEHRLKVKMAVLCDVAPSSLVKIGHCFEGPFCHRHQGDCGGDSKYLWNVWQTARRSVTHDCSSYVPRREPEIAHGFRGRGGVLENRLLGEIAGPQRDEVPGDWRKLHNDKLHNLYC
jgi:hypothetical protein